MQPCRGRRDAVTYVDDLKARIPDWAKDIRLNLDAVILRSSLSTQEATGVALAAAYAVGDASLVGAISTEGVLSEVELAGCLGAAALMAMNNVWYPYVEMAGDADLASQPAQLRMNIYAQRGGIGKRQFEMFSLAASIVGKCPHCVRSHYDTLRAEGLTAQQLRDMGRIAAVVVAASKAAALAGAGA